jgi:CheY-like chemotaxis protein
MIHEMPDLALLDVKIPYVDGYRFYHLLQQPPIKIEIPFGVLLS